ncbi:MAG: hypothetical protein EZS28_039098, partial [Streblomastix strix]
MQNDDVSTTYFDNKIITIKDINGLIDTTYEDNSRRAFKMQFLFGTISEELQQGKFVYDHQPLLDSHIQQYAPAMITNQQTIDQYKLYIKSCIIEMQDFQITESTKYRYIGIYAMMVKVSRFPLAGLCMKELIDKHYKSHKQQLFYQVSNLNDCFWLAYAKWLLQGKVSPDQIRCEAKKQMREFYNLTKKQCDTFINDYKGFDVVDELNKFIIKKMINVNIFYYDNDDKFYYLGERKQYNKIKNISVEDNSELQQDEPTVELLPTFNILLVSDTNENQDIYHVFHVTNTDGLTRQKYCPHCYQQSFDPKDDHYKRDYDSHVSQCKINGGQIIKKVKLDEQPFPYIPHIQRNETYAYLLANNATQQFKPTHYYITYDFETVERKVNTYFGKPLTKDSVIRNSQWISVLEPLSVASTIKLKWREQYNNDTRYKKITTPFGTDTLKTIYYDLRQGTDFISQWIEQVFEEAKQVALDNKYDNQDIPYNQCVSIVGFNSSRFDQALFSKYLHNDKWTIQSYIGTMRQGKQIVVEHKQTHQQIKFIDAMNYTQPTDLANFAKDFGNKDNESKGLFPYEGITYDNYNYELNKSQPFSIRAFDSQLKNMTMNDYDYQLYLSDAKNYATRWDYLQHYNELDTQIMIQPLDNLINWFYQYNVDML